MKTILVTTIVFLSVLKSFGQSDSLNMKTGPLALEARDVEYISSLFVYNQPLQEFFYVNIRDKYNSAGSLAGTSIIRIDSVKVSTLMYLSSALRNSTYGITKNVYNRIDAAIRACNNSFLNNYMVQMDRKEEDAYNAILLEGRTKLGKTP